MAELRHELGKLQQMVRELRAIVGPAKGEIIDMPNPLRSVN
jgi:hypothetical protein